MTAALAPSTAAPCEGANLREQVERLQGLLDGALAGVWEWNVQTGAMSVNQRWAEMLGHTLDELQPISVQTWADRLQHDDREQVKRRWREHFDGQRAHCEIESRLRHHDGHWVWVKNCGHVATRTAEGHPLLVVGTQMDITERKALEHQLFNARHTDRLTGLPNRAMLLQRLERAVASLQANPNERFALLFVDFDRFKNVNATWAMRPATSC